MITRRPTKKIQCGDIYIGGNSPITVQSMVKRNTEAIKSVIKDIRKVARVGCDIIRVAVPNKRAAEAIKDLKKTISIPLVADIHFNYKLAILAAKNGADKLRINPGNIGAKWKVNEVIQCASSYNIPIRIGVNAGSLEKRYKRSDAKSLVSSVLSFVDFFESKNFQNIVLSLKASDVLTTIEAYRKISKLVDSPLHIGITEAGTPFYGSIRSSVGIGSLLADGIGDTIRVSLTGSMEEKVMVGTELLKSLGLRNNAPTIISCPTCGRCEIDLTKIVKRVEKRIDNYRLPIKIAIMGCVVNGPGEAKEADIGIAGGKRVGLLFKKGKPIKKVKEEQIVDALFSEIDKTF